MGNTQFHGNTHLIALPSQLLPMTKLTACIYGYTIFNIDTVMNDVIALHHRSCRASPLICNSAPLGWQTFSEHLPTHSPRNQECSILRYHISNAMTSCSFHLASFQAPVKVYSRPHPWDWHTTCSEHCAPTYLYCHKLSSELNCSAKAPPEPLDKPMAMRTRRKCADSGRACNLLGLSGS